MKRRGCPTCLPALPSHTPKEIQSPSLRVTTHTNNYPPKWEFPPSTHMDLVFHYDLKQDLYIRIQHIEPRITPCALQAQEQKWGVSPFLSIIK